MNWTVRIKGTSEQHDKIESVGSFREGAMAAGISQLEFQSYL